MNERFILKHSSFAIGYRMAVTDQATGETFTVTRRSRKECEEVLIALNLADETQDRFAGVA